MPERYMRRHYGCGSGKMQRDPPGTAQPSVDLDNAVFPRLGVERVLDVALAYDAEMADDVDGSRTKHVEICIGERLRRCNDD